MNQMAEALLRAGIIDEKQHKEAERHQEALLAQEDRQTKKATDSRQTEKRPERAAKRPVSVTGALSGGTRQVARA